MTDLKILKYPCIYIKLFSLFCLIFTSLCIGTCKSFERDLTTSIKVSIHRYHEEKKDQIINLQIQSYTFPLPIKQNSSFRGNSRLFWRIPLI